MPSKKKPSKKPSSKTSKKPLLKQSKKPSSKQSKQKYNITNIYNGKLYILSRDTCPYCVELKKILKNYDVTEIDQQTAQKFAKLLGIEYTTIPQLFSIYDNNIFYLGDLSDTKARLT